MENKQLTDLEIAIKLEEIEREEYQLNTCDIIFERAALIDIEENKQETTGKKFYESADAVITVSKQETFEEVANNWIKNTSEFLSVKNGFVAGAKWQAERMYSGEEVLNILYKHTEDLLAGKKITLEQWFEQYKKK